MRFSHLLCLLAGGALVAAIALPGRLRPEPPARPLPAPSPDLRVDELAERLDQLASALERIDALAARLERAERSLAEARAHQPDVVVLEPPRPVPTQQRRRALALTRDLNHAAEALAAWRAIEEGSVDPKHRAEACFEQGQIQVKVKDWNAAADSFRKVVELIGLGSSRGQTAAYQLGWCESRRGDNAAAYEAFRRLCASPDLMKAAAPTYRFQMASFARAFDPETARREFERYVADYGDDPGPFSGFVKHARDYLAKSLK